MFSFPELAAAGVTTISVDDVSPGHGIEGDSLSDMAHDDMDPTISVSDDMVGSAV